MSRKTLLLLMTVFLGALPSGAQAVSYYNGVDVSKWQGTIDWSTVSASGIGFAFIKATEGVDYVDPTFVTNINSAHAAGIYASPYHYATPYTNGVDDSVAEANDFVAAISPYMKSGYLRPALDLEESYSLGSDVLSAWVCSFASRVKTLTGVKPIIYCNSNCTKHYLNSTVTDYTLWVANWTYDTTASPSTGVWNDWGFWQWSNQGSVPGINARVDLDVCRSNPAAYAVPEPSGRLLLLVGVSSIVVFRWCRRHVIVLR